MALLASSNGAWVAFAWGPALAVYNIETKQYSKLECTPPAPTAASSKEKEADEDGVDGGADEKKAAGGGAATGPMHIRVIKFSPDGAFLVSGGDDKVVYVWRIAATSAGSTAAAATCVATHVAKKRIAALTFVPGATPTVLYGDRIGDVNSFVVPASALAATATAPSDVAVSTSVFGHLAAMTDLVYAPIPVSASSSGSGSSGTTTVGYVLSADDEAQVRVSHFPHLYNIQSFCLHHRGFINCVTAIPSTAAGDAPLAVSGGGDAQLSLWNIFAGTRIATHSFAAATAAAPTAPPKRVKESELKASTGGGSSASSGYSASLAATTRYVSSMAYSVTHHVLAVTVNSVSSVFVFRITPKALTLAHTLPLPTQTSGVGVCWNGAWVVVATRRIPSLPAAGDDAAGAASAAAAVSGIDPLLSVFHVTGTTAAAAAAAASGAGTLRFDACSSASTPVMAGVNARFAELMMSSPTSADLVGDEYAAREQLKLAKLADAKGRKTERVQNKINKKQNKKLKQEQKQQTATATATDDADDE